MVPHQQGRPEGSARIARRRLNPDFLERSLAAQPPVRHAIERHAARHGEPPQSGEPMRMPRGPEDDGFADRLHRGRQIHILLCDLTFRIAGGAAKQPVEFFGRHREALAIIEVGHVQPERPVLADIDDVVEDGIEILGRAVRRQAHQLVFAGIHFEAGIVRKRRIEHAERMRKPHFVHELDGASAPNAE